MADKKLVALIVVLAVAVVASFSVFTVDEREYAIKFRLGEVVRDDYEPGLHFKIPFVQNVRKFDRRVLPMDIEPERFLTLELKNLIVDSFLKWRITDPTAFYRAVGGDEAQARQRLEQIIKDGMRSEFGKRDMQEAIAEDRAAIMDVLTASANVRAAEMGVTVVDVRIKRIDLPDEVSQSVFERMEAERERVARDFRARGEEEAERIRADADRRREEILAAAFRDAERIRGEADATAAATYREAFTQDESFYVFYRSLDAYRESFKNRDDMLVLQPDTEFFRYFRTAGTDRPERFADQIRSRNDELEEALRR